MWPMMIHSTRLVTAGRRRVASSLLVGRAIPKAAQRVHGNLASIVLQETREKLVVRGPRGSRKITKLEAAVMQLGNKAAQGDLRALREFFSLVQRSGRKQQRRSESPLTFSEIDQQVMKSMLKRMQKLRIPERFIHPERYKVNINHPLSLSIQKSIGAILRNHLAIALSSARFLN